MWNQPLGSPEFELVRRFGGQQPLYHFSGCRWFASGECKGTSERLQLRSSCFRVPSENDGGGGGSGREEEREVLVSHICIFFIEKLVPKNEPPRPTVCFYAKCCNADQNRYSQRYAAMPVVYLHRTNRYALLLISLSVSFKTIIWKRTIFSFRIYLWGRAFITFAFFLDFFN